METFEIEDPNVTGVSGGNGHTARTVVEGLRGCKSQLIDSATEYYDETFRDPNVPLYMKAISIMTVPYDLCRTVTICLTSPEEYNRGTLFLATLLSPLWAIFYMGFEHETFLPNYPGFWVYVAVTTALAILVTIYAPEPTHNCGKPTPPIWLAVPLALYGFVVAATWIDYIADQLVEVLRYFGNIARIPNAVLGLTILAWGNSIGDLSTNLSMAKVRGEKGRWTLDQ